MIIIGSHKELLSLVHEEKKIIIYGAGKIAAEIIKYLPADGRYRIEGILVSDLRGNKDELFGIPVQSIKKSEFDRNIRVVIAVGGMKYQEEIMNILAFYSYKNIAVISKEFELELNPKTAVTKQPDRYKRDIAEIKNCIKRLTPRTWLKVLVVNICDHCNLNCCGCDHFSPIADRRFLHAKEIVMDLKRIREILDENVGIISVMGGEPLLHPELKCILELTRKVFPTTSIWLSTNGLLLLEQDADFWECCINNNIEINVTKYPVSFAYDEAEKKARKYGVKYMYYNKGIVEKTMGHYPLDVNGSKDATESFMHCFHANNECNMLNQGRLYTCTIAPNIPIFNKKYGMNIPLTAEDGVDIYTVSGRYELFERLSRPMPVCRYCDVLHRTGGKKWERSKGQITEWT